MFPQRLGLLYMGHLDGEKATDQIVVLELQEQQQTHRNQGANGRWRRPGASWRRGTLAVAP